MDKVMQNAPPDLLGVAKALIERHGHYGQIPDIHMEEAGRLLDDCMGLIFPHLSPNRPKSAREIEARMIQMIGRLRYVLCEVMPEQCAEAAGIALRFARALPEIADTVREDAEAALAGDPAAGSLDEVILAYPSIYAVAAYRLANRLVRENVPLLPRLMSEYAHRLTGVDINPGATIGHGLFLDHATSVVIGQSAVIGNHVKIYQGVTLGALSVKRDYQNTKRHPTIEDDVVIYANATILGGETVIGRGSVIGGNVWLTKSVPPGSRVMYRSVGWQGLAEPEPERSDDFTI
ncbi:MULTISPECIES: hypothetical protein [unclassified Iodidimonas]|jgi:serine O-acetyltransferase|uniref:serine O-acetyltransferase n=1 Tax=unclassified Iodidimonas TaxID=2626145 RepID=UPI00248275BF|nr:MULTISPECIES: hypothetical protein [unclassified Iodidimonas]